MGGPRAREGLLLLAALAVLLAPGVGCGGSEKTADMATLRLDVATQPLDADARRRLARRAHQERRGGEALRELLWVHERESLQGSDRKLLGALLLDRASERQSIGDPDALLDLELASRLGVEVDETVWEAAHALCAVALLRHSSTFRQEEAARCMNKLTHDSVLRQYDSMDHSSLEELEILWGWFGKARAKRRELAVAQAYVDKGGRKPERLQRWRVLHRWWFGRRRPLLPVGAALAAGSEPSAVDRFEHALVEQANAVLLQAESLAEDWNAPRFADSLAEITEGYRKDPALADRLARRFADGSPYVVRAAALLCELFYRLEDVERAREWAQRIVDAAPRLPAAHEAAGLAYAVSGMPEKAGIHLVAAAAASGDAGATWGRAARAFRQAGELLSAVDAGRQAISHTAKGWDMHLLLEVSFAQAQMGRTAQAQATLEALWARFPLEERARARRLAAARNEKGPRRLATVLGPIRTHLGFPAATAR